MYFSKRNEETTYIDHYSGLIEVKGKGALLREDTEVWPEPEDDWPDEYDTLSITEGITELGEGFLEAFPKIDCLILSRSVTAVAVSPAHEKRMRRRKVLVCGEYGTYAEEFALAHQLRFLHSDIPLAEDRNEARCETDFITLRFFEDGTSDIHHNVFTSGSSSSHYGGGEYADELPRDFFVGSTIEAFAERFPERLRDRLTNNAMLRRFFEAANERLGADKQNR